MKSTNRIDLITCPNCGAQYTAGEIYLPKVFLGVPKDIEREATTKKILHDFGTQMNTRERYVCDFCDTPFKINAFVKFNVEEDTKYNFNKDYTTSLSKNQLFLKED